MSLHKSNDKIKQNLGYALVCRCPFQLEAWLKTYIANPK